VMIRHELYMMAQKRERGIVKTGPGHFAYREPRSLSSAGPSAATREGGSP
jgi:hypothetical protein